MENDNNYPKGIQEDQKNKHEDKTGVIPDSELAGSDADKAYSEDGTFKQLDSEHTNQKGADADADE